MPELLILVDGVILTERTALVSPTIMLEDERLPVLVAT
jgi:hypothetical protein